MSLFSAARVPVFAAALVALCLSPATAGAVPAPDYSVVSIPPPVIQADATFGERVRAVDDVNDDGVDDVLMSSSGYDGEDPLGAPLANTGRVYLFSGKTQKLLRVIDAPFPQAGGRLGFWDASLGDVDGDGAGDFASSAPGMIINMVTQGQVYIFSGRTGARLRTINPPIPITPVAANGGDFGGNLIGPGDLNGDGVGDLVVTSSGSFNAAGSAYAYDGKTGAHLYTIMNPDVVTNQTSSFGFGAAELGDVNGDGTND
jgi:hypothetical protein